MTFLIPLVARMGVPERLQRIVAWALVLAVIVALLIAGIAWWRSTIRQERAAAVQADRDAANLDALRQSANASVIADKGLQDTQTRDRQNEKDLQREIDAAAPSNGAVGPVTGSVLERLRQQQAAGRR